MSGFTLPTWGSVCQRFYFIYYTPNSTWTPQEKDRRERHDVSAPAAIAALPCSCWAQVFTSLSSRVVMNSWVARTVSCTWLLPESRRWLRQRRFCIWRAAGGGRSVSSGNIIWESGFPATALCVRRTVRTVKSAQNKRHTGSHTNTQTAFFVQLRRINDQVHTGHNITAKSMTTTATGQVFTRQWRDFY